jgi:hypothetical protein
MNLMIQWICVAVIILIIAVWVVRYIIGLVKWSKQLKRGGSALPPCCDPNARRSASCSACSAHPASCREHNAGNLLSAKSKDVQRPRRCPPDTAP